MMMKNPICETGDLIVDSRDFVDAFPIDEDLAFNFLSCLNENPISDSSFNDTFDLTINDRQIEMHTYGNSRSSDLRIPVLGAAVGNCTAERRCHREIEIEAYNEIKYSKKSYFRQFFDRYQNICGKSLLIHKDTMINTSNQPQVQSYHQQRHHRQRNHKQSQRQSWNFESDRSEIRQSVTDCNVSIVKSSGGILKQPPFRRMKKTQHEKKTGTSFAQLLIPSLDRSIPVLTPPNQSVKEIIKIQEQYRQSLIDDVPAISSYFPLYGITSQKMLGSKKQRSQINDRFRKENPWIHRSITLTKLRNLKFDLFELIEKVSYLDPSTVAMGWTYFERLISNHYIQKSTRKQLAGSCLMLAYKFNQELKPNKLKDLTHAIQTLDRKDPLTPHAIFASEFHVFTLIEFTMQLTFADIAPHLLEYFDKSKDESFEAYYGMSPESFAKSQMIPVSPQRHDRKLGI